MDKILEFTGKFIELLLNRKLMVLVAGISSALLILSYLMPPDLLISGVRPYLFFATATGAAGILVHWGFDYDDRRKSYHFHKQIESSLKNPEPEVAQLLKRFLQQNTSVMWLYPWEPGVIKAAGDGILVRGSDESPNGMFSYCFSKDAARYIARKRDAVDAALRQFEPK